MTVFEGRRLGVITRWGTPFDYKGRAELPTETTSTWVGQWGEVHGDIESERPLTKSEFDVSIAYFVSTWVTEHPEARIQYVEATYGSSQHIVVQFEIMAPTATYGFWFALAGFVAILFAIAVQHAVGIGIAIGMLLLFYALYKRIVPGQEHYTCDICGATCFGTYEELAAHYRDVHPGYDPPPKPLGIGDYIKYSILIVGVGIAVGAAFKLA